MLEAGQALPRSLVNPNISLSDDFGALADAETGRPATCWIAALAATVKPRTRTLYANRGCRYVLAALGHLKIRQIHSAPHPRVRCRLAAGAADGAGRTLKHRCDRAILRPVDPENRSIARRPHQREVWRRREARCSRQPAAERSRQSLSRTRLVSIRLKIESKHAIS
jgi:hypothetical protein